MILINCRRFALLLASNASNLAPAILSHPHLFSRNRYSYRSSQTHLCIKFCPAQTGSYLFHLVPGSSTRLAILHLRSIPALLHRSFCYRCIPGRLVTNHYPPPTCPTILIRVHTSPALGCDFSQLPTIRSLVPLYTLVGPILG